MSRHRHTQDELEEHWKSHMAMVNAVGTEMYLNALHPTPTPKVLEELREELPERKSNSEPSTSVLTWRACIAGRISTLRRCELAPPKEGLIHLSPGQEISAWGPVATLGARCPVVADGKSMGEARFNLLLLKQIKLDPWVRPYFDPLTKELRFQDRDGMDIPRRHKELVESSRTTAATAIS